VYLKILTIKKEYIMKNKLIIIAAAIMFSMSAYADSNHKEMDHSKMDHSKMTPQAMESMHQSMEQEMLKIINTVDINQRKKRFFAHKEKMKSMKSMMKGKCAK
jgi:uncharacterized phage infection (PIP) family protein YhgE